MIILSGTDNLVDCPICEGRGHVGASIHTTIAGATLRRGRRPAWRRRDRQSCPECGGSGKLDRNRGYRSSLD